MFLEALARDLERTQRAIPASCLFCVPQPRSLVADHALTLDEVYTHFLTPADAGAADDAQAHMQRPGEYETLNGKNVSIQGSHVVTGRGFAEPRKVRILLSESRDVHRQRVTVLHLSRPLQGGVAVPEDPNELDVATLRRLTAILRAFPEHELTFVDLDAAIAHVHRICARAQLAAQYTQTLPALLRDEFDAAVDAMLRAGSLENSSSDDDDGGDGAYGSHAQQQPSHLLQIQQVVECYLLEPLHDALFPLVVASCRAQEATLCRVLWRMRHYSPQDFGIRAGLQCDVQSAVDALRHVAHRKTPLAMLLALKRCLDAVSDAITRNLKQHNLDLGRYQMTTDDILDQLLYVLVQTYTRAATDEPSHANDGDDNSDAVRPTADEPLAATDGTTGDDAADVDVNGVSIVAVLQYISHYHFINSNTTALGFTVANFQVAVEFFLLRAAHIESSCRVCARASASSLTIADNIDGTGISSRDDGDGDDGAPCAQGVLASQCEVAYVRNVRDLDQLAACECEPERRDDNGEGGEEDDTAADSAAGNTYTSQQQRSSLSNSGDQTDNSSPGAFEQLAIVGEWSSAPSSPSSAEDDSSELDYKDSEFDSKDDASLRVHFVHFAAPGEHDSNRQVQVVAMSAGQRFFAAVGSRGELFTWGDRSGARLGYAASAGEPRRVVAPRRVSALAARHVLHVACGAFHTLAADVNGHVFAWGSNTRGQLGLFGDSGDSIVETAPPPTVETPTLVTQLCGAYVGAVACGEYHSLALTSTGHVFSWGCNRFAKLGRATESSADAHPTALDESWTARALDLRAVRCAGAGDDASLRGVVRCIAAGKDHSLAVTYDGAVFTWGRGDSGQLGHGSVADVTRPTQVMALSGTTARDGFCVVDADGGSDFSLFLVASGAAFVAGRDPSRAHASARGDGARSDLPALFPELVNLPCRVLLHSGGSGGSSSNGRGRRHAPAAVVGVSCGEAHFALLLSDDTVLVSNSSSASSDEAVSEPGSDKHSDGTDTTESSSSSAQTHASSLGSRPTARVTCVESLERVKRVVCGGSHTLVLS